MFFVNIPIYAIVLILSSLVCGLIFWRFYNKNLKQSGTSKRRRPAPVAAGVRRNNFAGRRSAARMRHDSESDDDHSSNVDQTSNQDDDLNTTSKMDMFQKKVGTKKAAKLAEKERRKEEREAEERYREHNRKLEDKEIEKRKKAEEAEAKAASEKAAAESKRREEEEARERAEYELLKQQFTIEGEGMEEPELDLKAETQINANLIQTIKEAKVISIERLAVNFNIKTETCIEKIRSLMASNRLTGVLDDRGKFIFITNEEFENVAKFIENRGRVNLTELVQNGQKLIKINSLRC